jgi:hypothetical protein
MVIRHLTARTSHMPADAKRGPAGARSLRETSAHFADQALGETKLHPAVGVDGLSIRAAKVITPNPVSETVAFAGLGVPSYASKLIRQTSVTASR